MPRPPARPTGWIAAAALIAAIHGPVNAASLFKPITITKIGRAPELLLAPLPVKVDIEALRVSSAGDTLEAALPDGRLVLVRIDRLENHDNGDISWIGRVADPTRSDLMAVGTTGAAGTYAEFETAGGSWGIVPSPDGHDWLFDKTAAQLNLPLPQRADDALIPPERVYFPYAKATCPTVASMPTPQVTIDVMAVMTPDFVSTHGGAAGAETRLNSLFTNMNAYNAASNVAITYRRVATMNATYQAASTAGDNDSDALTSITNGTGSFAHVAAMRTFFGADMVALFRGPKNTQGTSISGVAWLNGDANGNMPSADASYMYSVNGDWTFPGATLPSHELGHNLGNSHDRPNAGSGIGSTTYAYGHYVCGTGAASTCGQSGFNNAGTGFGTIMAYHRPTVAKFSSPSLTCQGTQAGAISAACGVLDQQDDVRAMNCIRQSVATFKSSWVGNCASLTTDTDRDGIPDCLESGSGRVNGARDNDIFNGAMLFAAQQYRDFLSREADADGLNYWTASLTSAPSTRGSMVEGFFNSTEFQGLAAPVARLYFAYFLRIPDYGGLQHWIAQYKTGTPLLQISQAFAASPEFISRYGSLSNSQFVNLVYTNVLGRAPDAAGLAYWNGQLASGAIDRGGLMVGFSESAEYKILIGNEVYVTMIYSGMLRRAPDQSGFNFWVDYLDKGNSGAALIGGFLGATEYRQRFLP